MLDGRWQVKLRKSDLLQARESRVLSQSTLLPTVAVLRHLRVRRHPQPARPEPGAVLLQAIKAAADTSTGTVQDDVTTRFGQACHRSQYLFWPGTLQMCDVSGCNPRSLEDVLTRDALLQERQPCIFFIHSSSTWPFTCLASAHRLARSTMPRGLLHQRPSDATKSSLEATRLT